MMMMFAAAYHFTPVIILIAMAILLPIIFSILKLNIKALFAIEILIGILLAPQINKFIETSGSGTIIDALYLIGIVLLIFLSGYDTDISVFKEKQKIPVVKLVLIIFISMYLLGFASALLLSHFYAIKMTKSVILLTLAFSTTFAGVVVPLVIHKNIHRTDEGKVINTFATLAELVSIVALSIYMIVNKINHKGNPLGLLLLLLVFVGIYIIRNTGWVQVVDEKFPENEFPLKLILIALLGVVVLSEVSGVEDILGAFLLGMLLKVLKPSPKAISTIETISYGFLFPILFLIIGSRVDIYNSFKDIEIIKLSSIFALTIILTKLPALYLLKYFNTKNVLATILILSSTIIVGFAVADFGFSGGIFSYKVSESLKIASLITAVIPPLLFDYLIPTIIEE